MFESEVIIAFCECVWIRDTSANSNVTVMFVRYIALLLLVRASLATRMRADRAIHRQMLHKENVVGLPLVWR